MSQSVRVGVVSTSWWADKMFLPALKSHAQADVVAICGRNRTRAEEMAGKYGVRAVFADYRKMIEQGGLDAVIVGVPDDLHYEVTMQALHAGLHVLCEQSYWGDADPCDPSTIFTQTSAGSRLFIDAILANRPVSPNFYDGYRAQQIVDAAIASHETGCAVAIAQR